VSSAASVLVPGPAFLASSTEYSWSVNVTLSNQQLVVSASAAFVTALAPTDWAASWITGGYNQRQLRTEFSVNKTFSRAYAHVSGLGYFELWCNGHKVGDHMLDVGWTDYAKRSYYVTLDITDCLKPGRNAFGVMLGNSWFSCAGSQPGCINTAPQLMMQATGYDTSSVVTFASSNTADWKVHSGPIIADSLYNGETYNALLETPGWTSAGFDSGSWQTATAATWAPKTLSPQSFPPIRKLRAFSPRQITLVGDKYIVDFGQNTAGIVRLTVRDCPAGNNITLRHAELLQHPPYGPRDGSIYVGNLRGAKATDIYTCKGEAEETYEPRFTQHGFKYAEISGLTYAPREQDVTAFEMHSDVEEAGSFSSSANTDLLDLIHHCVVWGQKSNLMSVATDCPQRDERRGWTGDAGLTSEEAMLNFDMAAFYNNWLNVYSDDQNADGSSNDFVPSLGDGKAGAPNWQTAYPTLVWTLLRYRGDTNIVKQQWPQMRKYSAFLDAQYKKGGLKNYYVGYGDWVPPPPAKKAEGHLVSSFAVLRDLQILIEMADAIGETQDAADLRARYQPLCKEFNSAFYNSNTKTYGSGLQTEQSMGLWLGCVPPADLDAALEVLVKDVAANGDHTTTGIIGWKFSLEVLSNYNFADVALKMNLIETYPSFGYMIRGAGNAEPATTVWELWDSDREGPGMNSRNHIMFGTNGGWLYKGLAGVSPSEKRGESGFRTVNLGPKPSAIGAQGLVTAAASTQTPYGPASVSWGMGASSTCGEVAENNVLQLACPAGTFTKVLFASYGNANGDCDTAFTKGSCDSPNSAGVIEAACVGKSTCSVAATNEVFKTDPCFGTAKSLAVSLQCSGASGKLFMLNTHVPVGAMGNVEVAVVAPQTPDMVVIQESGKIVWKQGAFVAGATGVIDARLQKYSNGGASIVFTTTNGAFHFTSQ